MHILWYSPSVVVQHYHPPWSPKEPDCAQKYIFLAFFYFFYRVLFTFTAKSPSFVGLLAVKLSDSG
jgi:hypothetical protein